LPSKLAAIDWLKYEVEQGRGDEVVHVIDVQKEQRARIANDGPTPKTRFQIELDDPQLYIEWNREKDRIVKRFKVKAIAVDYMWKVWEKYLSDQMIDKLLAIEEGADNAR